jgi:hypothetical protein
MSMALAVSIQSVRPRIESFIVVDFYQEMLISRSLRKKRKFGLTWKCVWKRGIRLEGRSRVLELLIAVETLLERSLNRYCIALVPLLGQP